MVSNEKNVFGKLVFGYDKLSMKWISSLFLEQSYWTK